MKIKRNILVIIALIAVLTLSALLMACANIKQDNQPNQSVEQPDNNGGGEQNSGNGEQNNGNGEQNSNPKHYVVNYVTDEHGGILVFDKGDLSGEGQKVTSSYAKNGATGEVDVSGDGQVNFVVTLDEGFEVDTVKVENADVASDISHYKNLKSFVSELDFIENQYRITKITGDLIVTITTKQISAEENPLDGAFSIKFVTDEHLKVKVFETQDITADGEIMDTVYAKNGTTGKIDKTGSGQVNFVVLLDDGFEVDKLTITNAQQNLANQSYSNIKSQQTDPSFAKNQYRVTKICGDIVITITSKIKTDNDEPQQPQEGFKVDFIIKDNSEISSYTAQILIYYKQNYAQADEILDDKLVAFARNSTTGEIDVSGDGQINFTVAAKEGFELVEVTFEGAGGKLKDISTDSAVENTFRITKISGAITVTVKMQKSSQDNPSLGENTTEVQVPNVISTDITDGYDYSAQTNAFTIKKAGTYSFSGELNEGQIIVEAPSDATVKIELNGFKITNSNNSPIYILTADSVDISAKNGSENFVSDTRTTSTNENETLGTGAIYAECDLTLKGKGTLTVESAYNNGIHTKDDLKIQNLELNVKAVNNALKGNDSITIESGKLTVISTGGDALKTTNNDLSSKSKQRGVITILDGVIDLYAACDGVDSASDVVISGGKLNIYTDEYSPYSGDVKVKSESTIYLRMNSSCYNMGYTYSAYFFNANGDYKWVNMTFHGQIGSQGGPGGGGGWPPRPAPGGGRTTYYYYKVEVPNGFTNVKFYAYTSSQTPSQSENYAAVSNSNTTIPATSDTYVVSSISTSSKTISNSGWTSFQSSSGNTGLDYSCKGIKADNTIKISGGVVTIKSKDDGIHANFDEVLESTGQKGLGNIEISGGSIEITCGDDGIRADQDLKISGGMVKVLKSYEGLEANRIYLCDNCNVTVIASDDGINANSKGAYSAIIEISGGYVDVQVPSGDTDTIDSNGKVVITGGLVLLKNGNGGSSFTGGTIDTDNGVTVSGGTVIAVGCIGDKITNSTYNTSTTLSKGNYEIKDANGTVIAQFELAASYKAYMFYSDLFISGQTYYVYRDGESVMSFKK